MNISCLGVGEISIVAALASGERLWQRTYPTLGKSPRKSADPTGSRDGRARAQPDAGHRPPRREFWLAALIVGIGVGVYGNSVYGVFVHDDENAILHNPSIRRLWPLTDVLRAPVDTPVAGRPVVTLTFALNYAVGRLEPSGYHLVNIAIHLLNALVLFGIVRRTLESGPMRARFGESARMLAAASALLWMVHPLQTEVVNYVTQRTESLMALFYLLTLYCAIRAREEARGGLWTLAAVVASALGMASKETMVTAPLMVVLYDRVFPADGSSLRRRLPLYAGLAATWVLLAALMAGGPRSGTVGFGTEVTGSRYALNQCRMIIRYLRLTLWPHPLVFDYGVPQPITVDAVWPQAALLAVLAAATLVGLVKWPPLGFAGAWLFVMLAPTSSVVPIATEVGAERRMYLPLAALVVLGVCAGSVAIERLRGGTKGRRRPEGAVVVAALIVLLGGLSIERNKDYWSVERIWRTVVERWPHGRAHNNFGAQLAREGRWAEAAAQFKLALPDYADELELRYNLGQALERTGQIDEAIEHYRAFLEKKPADAIVQNLLGLRLADRGDLAEAVVHFREAIRLKPDEPGLYTNLGQALLKLERYDEAGNAFRFVLSRDPRNAAIHNNLGLTLVSRDKLGEAIREFQAAVDLDPANALNYFNLGLALILSGRRAEGLRQLDEAVRRDPSMRAAIEAALRR